MCKVNPLSNKVLAMNCFQCGETNHEPRVKFCRRCGANLRDFESDCDSGNTRRIQGEDIFFSPNPPKQVVSIEKPRCIIHLSFSSEWLTNKLNVNQSSFGDDGAREEAEFCSRLPGFAIFESVPTSEIRFALEKTLQQRFGKNLLVRARLPPKNIRSTRRLPKSGIVVDWASITFTIAFDYYVTDFHADKELIQRSLKELLNELYDWSSFSAGIDFRFWIPFKKFEL